MALSIIIPARDESLLWFTIQRLKETRGKMPLEIIVMDDGSQTKYDLPHSESDCTIRLFRREDSLGVDASRDAGILKASNPACLVIDGHCNFWGELNPWPEILVTHATEYPQDFGCCVCVGLAGPDRYDMHGYWFDDHGKHRFRQHDRCYGAHIRLKDHDGSANRIFCDKWNSNPDLCHGVKQGMVQEVGCPLGGAYLLNREWYLDGLKRPWHGLKGWGTSEIALALPNWLMGGRNVLLPVEIGHAFRTGSPYTLENWKILFNQLRLLAILPVSEEFRIGMLDYLRENKWSDAMWDKAKTELQAERTWPAYLELLAKAPRSFAEWRKEWISD
jgi:glycosyltransferase involved in cell wall biosynthesis